MNMWQRIISNIAKIIDDDIASRSEQDMIMEKLNRIEKQIERQEKMAQYRFQVGLGISFIVLGLGVKIATDSLDWLALFTAIGGYLVMFAAGIQYREDINKKTAGWGIAIALVGLAISAIYLYYKNGLTPFMFILGIVFLLIGLLVLIIASRSRRKPSTEKS